MALSSCKNNAIQIDNLATAIKDGEAWTAEAVAEFDKYFGDSLITIALKVPSPDGIVREKLIFFFVPLVTKEFAVIDTALFDSRSVVAYYVLLNSHGDVIQDQLVPSDDFENILFFESYDSLTNKLTLSFSVFFESRYPEPHQNWHTAFTGGKIETILE